MRATSEKDLSFQYFPFYVQAYCDSIAIGVLSLEAEACYHRLNARQWLAHVKGTTLPLDPMHVRLLTKATPIEWRDIWPELEGLYPVTEDGRGRLNPELARLWAERVAYLEQQRINGKKGGRPPGNPDESQQKPTGSKKGRKTKPNQNPQETDGFSLGSEWVPENSEIGNPTETSKLLVVSSPSPPPSGGGSSPATALRVLPGGKTNSARSGESDPFAQGDPPNLDALLDRVPFACRGPVAELLHHLRSPAKWAGWINALEQLITPDGADVPCPITWPHVAQGVSELLLVNPPGQRITPASVEAFVTAVPRRQMRASIPAAPGGTALVAGADPFAEYAAQQAAAGDPEYVEYCRTNGIHFTVKETA